MNKTLRIVLILLLAGALVFSLVKLAEIQREYAKAEKIYAESREAHFHTPAQELSPLPDTPEVQTPEKEEIFPEASADLAALGEINPEVIGWLWVPGTELSFPLVQGEDNNKYLNRSYELSFSNSGSIFLDYRNSPGFTDDNSAVYGHNMKNGGMFGNLKDFADKDYLEAHGQLYLFLEGKVQKYRIFAAYRTESTSESYTLDFSGDLSFEDYLAYVRTSAGENFTEPPGEKAPLLLLSTCTSERQTERFVVHATLTAEKETA